MNTTNPILIEELPEARILVATLNCPDNANGIDRAMAQALYALGEQAERASHIDAVIITGNGRVFCAGGDVSAFKNALASSPDALPELLDELATLVHEALEKLINAGPLLIGAINGPATGAGMALVCACDLTYARPGATLRAGFSRLGLSPDSGSTHLLPRRIGYAKALEFLLGGVPMSAEQAFESGLYSKLLGLEPEAFLTQVIEHTRTLLTSGAAVRATRALLRASPCNSLKQQLDAEQTQLLDLARTQSVKAGLAQLLGG